MPERIQVAARGRRVAEDFLAAAGTRDAWTRTRAALVARVRARIGVPEVAERVARAVLQR